MPSSSRRTQQAEAHGQGLERRLREHELRATDLERAAKEGEGRALDAEGRGKLAEVGVMGYPSAAGWVSVVCLIF